MIRALPNLQTRMMRLTKCVHDSLVFRSHDDILDFADLHDPALYRGLGDECVFLHQAIDGMFFRLVDL